MKTSLLHGAAGAIALLLIVTFWVSTLVSEVFLGKDAIVVVKTLIVKFGLVPLVVSMACTAAMGTLLSRKREGSLVSAKRKRMTTQEVTPTSR